jgi:hypothetical protein
MTKLTLGVIGCNATVTARYVSSAGRNGFTLQSIWAPGHPKVRGVASYSSAQALIDSDVQALAIGPNHSEVIRWAVRHGKHILLHQPVCPSMRGLGDVMAALNEAERRYLTVQLVRRFPADPSYLWLKRQLPKLRQRYGRLDEFGLTYSGPTDGESFSLNRVAQLGYFLDDLNYLRFFLDDGINRAEWLDRRPEESIIEGVTARYVKFRFWRQQRPHNQNAGCSVWLRFVKESTRTAPYQDTWCLLLTREGTINIDGEIQKVPVSTEAAHLPVNLRNFAAAINAAPTGTHSLATELAANYGEAAFILRSPVRT